MTLFEDKFIKYIYDEQKSLIQYYWKEETINMTKEIYITDILKGIDFVEKYRPEFIIADQQKQNFIVTIEIQEWNAKETLPKLFELGVRKFAVIESNDVIIQLATEQLFDETKNKKFGVLFFKNEKDARKWIFDN